MTSKSTRTPTAAQRAKLIERSAPIAPVVDDESVDAKTKTELRLLVRELRANAQLVQQLIAAENTSSKRSQRAIADALDVVDGISAQLRELLIND